MRRGETPDPQRLDDGLSAIDTMSTRVAFLLDDVVDMARDHGQQGVPFEPEPTDLVALARRCAEEVRSSAGRDVQVEAAAETVVGLWDARGIERVVLNLLTNAIKYSPQGGAVTIQVERVADDATPSPSSWCRTKGLVSPPPTCRGSSSATGVAAMSAGSPARDRTDRGQADRGAARRSDRRGERRGRRYADDREPALEPPAVD